MIIPGVVAAVVVVLVLGVGAWMTTVGPWYRDLRKPAWNPPDSRRTR
jgi:benzodiazapine receptor